MVENQLWLLSVLGSEHVDRHAAARRDARRGMRVSCALYSLAPDFQGFSFAFFGFLLPLVAEFLLRIWD